MILYFSGTGNSEYAAKRIGRELRDEVLNLFEKIRNHDYSEIHSDSPWAVSYTHLDVYKRQSPGRAVGEWNSDDTGWWFEHPDGTWTTDGWESIGGEWYYFDHSGYRKSGWIPWQGTWYYCGEDRCV